MIVKCSVETNQRLLCEKTQIAQSLRFNAKGLTTERLLCLGNGNSKTTSLSPSLSLPLSFTEDVLGGGLLDLRD